jgi:hypothetical protein
MVHKEMPLAIPATLLLAINMLVTGVLGYHLSGHSAYLYADVARGTALLALLLGYVRHVQSKRVGGIVAERR